MVKCDLKEHRAMNSLCLFHSGWWCVHFTGFSDIRKAYGNFPGGPVVRTLLPLQGTGVWSMLRELRSRILCWHGQIKENLMSNLFKKKKKHMIWFRLLARIPAEYIRCIYFLKKKKKKKLNSKTHLACRFWIKDWRLKIIIRTQYMKYLVQCLEQSECLK